MQWIMNQSLRIALSASPRHPYSSAISGSMGQDLPGVKVTYPQYLALRIDGSTRGFPWLICQLLSVPSSLKYQWEQVADWWVIFGDLWFFGAMCVIFIWIVNEPHPCIYLRRLVPGKITMEEIAVLAVFTKPWSVKGRGKSFWGRWTLLLVMALPILGCMT